MKRGGWTIGQWLLMIALIFILVFLLIPWRTCPPPGGPSNKTICKNNLKQIAIAYLMYCEDFNGRPPSKGHTGDQAYLDAIALLEPYLSYSPKLWVCPLSHTTVGVTSNITLANVSYAWRPDTVLQDAPNIPFLALFWDRGVDPTGTNRWTSSAHGITNGGNVVWSDGHVEWMTKFPGDPVIYKNAVNR